MSPSSEDIVLEARDIVKRYPGNVALDGITYRVVRNQVNVLIGENGAGKSTLMRILSGVEHADSGEIVMDGAPITILSPRDAARHGIAIVHQELAVLPNLDVSENVFAGRELTRGALIDTPTQHRESRSALTRLQQKIGVQVAAGQLSLGGRQLVELARALAHGSKILILDEPTSALSAAEAEYLFQVIADLKQSGVTIIYISHRLHELLHLGDQFTVLRSGKIVGQASRADVSREWIVERMSGKEKAELTPATAPTKGETNLLVSRLSLAPASLEQEAQAEVDDVSFRLHRGEILGIYGLLGSGRTETLEALAGLRPVIAGEVTLNGKRLELGNVPRATKAGMVLVPEDRQRDGLVPELSIRENVALASSSGPFISRAEETARVQALVGKLRIAAHDLELPVTALSGGNQQKVLLARCLLRSPSVLLLDEPTRGVDVGARAEIYRTLKHLAAEGLSILFTSSEVEETRLLADRALVLRQGRVVAEFPAADISDEALFTAASPTIASTIPPAVPMEASA